MQLITHQDLIAAKTQGQAALEAFVVKAKNDFLGSTARALMLEDEKYYEGVLPICKNEYG